MAQGFPVVVTEDSGRPGRMYSPGLQVGVLAEGSSGSQVVVWEECGSRLAWGSGGSWIRGNCHGLPGTVVEVARPGFGRESPRVNFRPVRCRLTPEGNKADRNSKDGNAMLGTFLTRYFSFRPGNSSPSQYKERQVSSGCSFYINACSAPCCRVPVPLCLVVHVDSCYPP